MLPSFLGIVAQAGGGPPPPPVGVFVSAQTLNVTYLTTTPAETFTFSAGATYLTDGESVTDFNYVSDPTTAFGLDFTGLTALTTATVSANPAMTTAPDFTGCTALAAAYVHSNASMTTAPDFTGCTALGLVNVTSCAVSDSNLLAMCTQISSVALANAGEVFMEGGTNGSFDGQSLPSQITDLQTAGWAVTFNDNNPPPVGVLISGQTLNVTYLTTTPAESFTFSGGATYLSNGESVTAFSYSGDPTTAFGLDLTVLPALTTAEVNSNAAMTSAPNFAGLTALTSANVYSNGSMTTAPNLSGCVSLINVNVSGCAISYEQALLDLCVQIYNSGLCLPSGVLNMSGGTNASFDGQDLPGDISQLQSPGGWNVIYNNNNP